jgi:hypothetical protein
MPECKAPEVLNREKYLLVRRMAKDNGNAAAGHLSILPLIQKSSNLINVPDFNSLSIMLFQK